MPEGEGENNMKEYLGDGVYVEFDGFMVILTTGAELSNVIYLEPEVVQALTAFIAKLQQEGDEA